MAECELVGIGLRLNAYELESAETAHLECFAVNSECGELAGAVIVTEESRNCCRIPCSRNESRSRSAVGIEQ